MTDELAGNVTGNTFDGRSFSIYERSPGIAALVFPDGKSYDYAGIGARAENGQSLARIVLNDSPTSTIDGPAIRTVGDAVYTQLKAYFDAHQLDWAAEGVDAKLAQQPIAIANDPTPAHAAEAVPVSDAGAAGDEPQSTSGAASAESATEGSTEAAAAITPAHHGNRLLEIVAEARQDLSVAGHAAWDEIEAIGHFLLEHI